MSYVNISHKPANHFRMVQLEDRIRFNKLLEEKENLALLCHHDGLIIEYKPMNQRAWKY